MMKILSSKQRDKGVFALRDVAKSMFGDPRRINLDELDEVQTILAGHGLTITALDNVKEVEVVSPPAAATTATPAVVPNAPVVPLNQHQAYWVETMIQYYLSNKSLNKRGYIFDMSQMGKLLKYTCQLAGIKFNP